jgi:hypothetical protein
MIDFVNGVENANPKMVELIASIGTLENFTVNGVKFTISHGQDHAVITSSSMYTGELREVKLVIPKLNGVDITGAVNTTIHEEFHLLDLLCRTDPTKTGNWYSTTSASLKAAFDASRTGMSTEVSDLFKAFQTSYDDVWKQCRDVYNVGYAESMRVYKDNLQTMGWTQATKIRETELKRLKKVRDETADYLNRNSMGGGVGNLQDIYDALSAGAYRDKGIIYGHGSKYYKHIESQLHETIANYGALSVTRPDLVDMLRRDKPDLVKELETLIEGMLGKVGGSP